MKGAHWQNPSIDKIAKVSGVSTATVDPVLHQRGGVSSKKVELVHKALDELRALHEPSETNEKLLKFGLLVDSYSSFNVDMKTRVERLNAMDRTTYIRVHSSLSVQFDPGAFSDKIIEWGNRYDGIIISGREHPAVSRAIETTIENGTGVFSLTTDQRNTASLGYAGMDQVSSGQCAAQLILKYAAKSSGHVVFVRSSPYRSQKERALGFRKLLRTLKPDLPIIELPNPNDNPDTSYRRLLQHLTSSDAPIAVYNVAGDNAGIARALRETGIKDDVLFVAHELNGVSMEMLVEDSLDFVIAHDMDEELLRAKRVLRAYCLGETPLPQYDLLPPVIKCKYNCS